MDAASSICQMLIIKKNESHVQDTTKRWNWSGFFVYLRTDRTRAARKDRNNLAGDEHSVWGLIDPAVSIQGHGSALKTCSGTPLPVMITEKRTNQK